MTVPPSAGGPGGTPPGRVPLDGPPPLPAQAPTAPNSGGYSSVGAQGEDPQKEAMKGLVSAFQTVDQILLSAANSLPQGGKEFSAARTLISQGLSKGLAAMGQAPEESPTAAGSQFPGGGFSSVGGLGK
jgi:hypothetical protein